MEKGSVIFKHKPEDFIVEEIHESGICKVSDNLDAFNKPIDLDNLDVNSKRPFLSCDLEKIDVDHISALSIISRQTERGLHQIGYAGAKDKKAWTCQRITIFDPVMDKVKSFSHPNILLKNFKWEKHKLKIGGLEGNKFRIVLRDADKDALKVLNRIRNTKEIPNFFGMQRFGSLRGDNVKIGKLILKKRYKEAVFAFLAGYGKDERGDVKKAKKRFKEEKDLRKAGEYFPDSLVVEHKILAYLSNDSDFPGSLKIMGEKNLLLMCQSVQSQLFNDILRIMNERNIKADKIQLIGCDSKFLEGQIGRIEQEVMECHALDFSDFNSKIDFLKLRKGERKAFFKVRDLDIKIEDDEFFSPGKKIILTFALDSGNYATTFLENFFELRP